MTTSIVSVPTSDVSDFTGGSESDVSMMIGIGLVKDSPAVFFKYLGDEQTPAGLTLPSGKPVTSIKNVVLAGIDIAEDVGEFKSTKLNLFLRTNPTATHPEGRVVMLTSGLTTYWSQSVLGGLLGMFNTPGLDLTMPVNIDSWYGTSKMRPVFAAVKLNGRKISDSDMYNSLSDARGDRDSKLIENICRDAVDVLRAALGIEAADVVVEDGEVEAEDLF